MIGRHIILIFSIVMLSTLYSCNKKTCPAYHSVFILHEADQHAYFSPFGEDSIPKTHSWGKKTNGISDGTTVKNYKKRHYKIPMKDYHGDPEETEWEFETSATDIDNMGEGDAVKDKEKRGRSGVE